MSRIYLLRHGETVGRSSIRLHGATDVALDDEGRAMARAAARWLQDPSLSLVVTSTLKRSVECGQIATSGRDVRRISLREFDFGDWEGLTRDEASRADPSGLAASRLRADPETFTFPGGESRAAFHARVLAGFKSLEEDMHRAGSLLIAAHRGVIRTLLQHLLDDQDRAGRFKVALGSLTSVNRRNGRFVLEELNRTDFAGTAPFARP